MSELLPSDADAEGRTRDGGALRLLWLDDEETEALIGSISSETARSILTTLHERPATASEVADAVDTSVQNARHHLDNLLEADLIRVTDTRRSVKGRQMNVYGPVDDALVVCVGREDDREGFFESIRRLVGAAFALGVAALVVQWGFAARVGDLGGPAVGPRVADGLGGASGPALGLLSPGVAFFAGGLLVLALALAWQYGPRLAR